MFRVIHTHCVTFEHLRIIRYTESNLYLFCLTTCFCCLTLQRYEQYLKLQNILAIIFEEIL